MINTESTMHEFLHFWNSESCTRDICMSTRKKRAHLIDAYMDPYIGGMILNSFNQTNIRLLQNHLSENSISSGCQDDTLRVLRNALNYAEKHNLIQYSLSSAFHLEGIIFPVSTYSPDQINSIFNALRYDPLCNFYKMIYFTLMKNMELKALRISDIDFSQHLLYVRNTIRSTPECISSLVPSGITRKRVIPLTDNAEKVLYDEIKRRKEKEQGIYWRKTENDYLFVHRDGSPYKYIDPKEASLLVETVAGIQNFSLKALRLTAVSVMLDQGVSPITIKNILGIDRLKELKRMEIQTRL